MSINLIEYFEDTVLKFSSKIAVIEKERKVSFGELAEKSKVLSTSILRKVNVINQPIAIYLPKSIEAIVADIACTYSGNMYMNLDVKTPSERIRNILDLIQPKVIITNHQYLKNISEIIPSGMEVINLDEMEGEIDIDEALIKSKWQSLIDTDPLCIINTSGSTGTPKGVVLNHRSYIDYTQWAIGRFDLCGNEILGVLSPILFDHYNFEISLMMTKGVTLVLLNNDLAAFPVKILEDVVRHNVSFIFWVPAIMVNIANMGLLDKMSLDKVKMVWFAGEVFPTNQFNIWRKHLPQATFVNLYGPVETTVDCTYYAVDRDISDTEPIPIGYPCRNTDVFILNDKNEKTKQGEEGELCVRGTSLAMGYYNNPEKTAAAFVQNPLNHSYPEIIYRTGDLVYVNARGEIVFKGRKDSLIKHLGYRIELGEIEHVIVNQLKLVKNCCVVYHREKKEITLFYEADNELTAAEFRIAIG
ncbi:MAG: amino acid adenylation domain-containing protein, partial [Odoribacter sp.]